MQWAEDKPVGFSYTADLPIMDTYHITGIIPLRSASELVGMVAFTGNNLHAPEMGDELHQLVGLLTLMAIEQRTTNNLNKFLGEFAHDQRNSLNVVSMSADMLNEMADMPPKSKVHLTRIFDNSLQIGNQIENALSVERYDPETDEYHMNVEEVDLIELRREICERYIQVAQGKKISIKMPYVRGNFLVYADLGMVTRAITNLVDNALKFTQEGGQIEVSLSKDKAEVKIAVNDNGPGINAENIERIFERKVRIRQARHVRGLGLGLYIVRNAALKHGGRAWVESTVGEGSTFYLALPLKPIQSSS